jgi:hypothetical protein
MDHGPVQVICTSASLPRQSSSLPKETSSLVCAKVKVRCTYVFQDA